MSPIVSILTYDPGITSSSVMVDSALTLNEIESVSEDL
jgi:hypothetical protein